ncbi:MAG: alpha/beta hydrolase family protein [Chitinophagaceae bacterium]
MKLIRLLFFMFLTPASTIAQTGHINEEKFIQIGGIEQWVTIKGSDTTRPVILFLHGGPGSVMSPYDAAFNNEWKKDFILVNWDQRGAGRTFGRNAPAEAGEDYWIENPLTVKRMTADAIELSEYLVKKLGKQRIIIVGTSWGSILGAKIALQRPDLYYAYIGHSQVVNASEGLVQAYNKVYQLSERTNDQVSLDKLKSLGTPPYDDAKTTGQLIRIIKKYEKESSIPAPASWWKPAPGYDSETDDKQRNDGDDYSFINYVGHKKLGIKAMMVTIDLMKDSLNFKIPVFLIQGESDILTPKETTKKYFDKIVAPKKEYFLVPGAAHGYNQPVMDIQYKIAKEFISTSINK